MKSCLLSGLLSLLLVTPAGAQPQDKAIDPTDWGHVIGHVFDARTGSPLGGASVTVGQDGEFAASGRTAGTTDSFGRYQCEAMLGRVSSNWDVRRLLTDSIFGILGGSATKKTKRIDISRLNLRVSLAGYRPFAGMVRCRLLSPARFEVSMEPVLLAASGSPESSTAADGWGVVRIRSVSVEPPTLRPGAKGTVRVEVQSPPVEKAGDLKVAFMSPLWPLHVREDSLPAPLRAARAAQGFPPVMKLRELKPVSAAAGDTAVYTGEFEAPRSDSPRVAELTAVILSSPYEQASEADPLRRQALVQIVPTEAGMQAAAARLEAFRLRQDGRNTEAAAVLRPLCDSSDAGPWELQQFAEISETLHDYPAAVKARKRLCEIAPAKEQMAALSRYAAALVSNAEGGRVVSECAPAAEKIKKKDWPKKVPVPLAVAMGQAYLQTNQLDQAAAINEALLKWPYSGIYPGTNEFRAQLRLAQAEAKLRADSHSAPARAEHARVLMDLGRWEEAADELRAALTADPNLPAAQRDLAYAQLHLTGSEAAAPGLDPALASAEAQVQVGDGKKTAKSADFFAWHSLAVLRYRKACQERDAADPAAPAMFARSQEAFHEALRYGRAGADEYRGDFSPFIGFTSARLVMIAGFAYPEAGSDFVILDSLKVLEKKPNDFLAQLNLGQAFLDLAQPELAAEPIRKALAEQPDDVEAQYAAGLLAVQNGDRETALARLQAVVKANPRHPFAQLKLAQLYTEGGDTAAAAACIAAHQQLYGTVRAAPARRLGVR